MYSLFSRTTSQQQQAHQPHQTKPLHHGRGARAIESTPAMRSSSTSKPATHRNLYTSINSSSHKTKPQSQPQLHQQIEQDDEQVLIERAVDLVLQKHHRRNSQRKEEKLQRRQQVERKEAAAAAAEDENRRRQQRKEAKRRNNPFLRHRDSFSTISTVSETLECSAKTNSPTIIDRDFIIAAAKSKSSRPLNPEQMIICIPNPPFPTNSNTTNGFLDQADVTRDSNNSIPGPPGPSSPLYDSSHKRNKKHLSPSHDPPDDIQFLPSPSDIDVEEEEEEMQQDQDQKEKESVGESEIDMVEFELDFRDMELPNDDNADDMERFHNSAAAQRRSSLHEWVLANDDHEPDDEEGSYYLPSMIPPKSPVNDSKNNLVQSKPIRSLRTSMSRQASNGLLSTRIVQPLRQSEPPRRLPKHDILLERIEI